MNQSTRTLTRTIAVCVCIFSLASGLRAQNTNSTGTIMWPNNPPVGIGTQLDGGPLNALHIHHDAAHSATLPAILRLSDGSVDSTNIFATLALMPGTVGFPLSSYSYLAVPNDVVLHENIGDLILADLDPQPAAIRMTTTPDPTTLPPAGPHVPPAYSDVERVTILSNGNIGINMPSGLGGLCAPLDQLQLGGGIMFDTAFGAPIPGLTFFGGDWYEGMPQPSPLTGTCPVDWRGFALNHWENHITGIGSRIAPMPWDQLAFGVENGGLISLGVFPWHSGDSLASNDSGVFLQVTGQQGLSMFCYEGASDPYHHLFDVYRPGVLPWGMTRNTNGAFVHHTPVYITSDSSGHPLADFMNLTNVHPAYGDGMTWDLAVNGPILGKEFYMSIDWPDYVFLSSYKLMSIGDFGNYIEKNHHLPDVPSAKDMAAGVPLGKTEAALTKQVEEMALYIVQMNKKLESLVAAVQELKNQKGK